MNKPSLPAYIQDFIFVFPSVNNPETIPDDLDTISVFYLALHSIVLFFITVPLLGIYFCWLTTIPYLCLLKDI